jgi:hypothetical protein
VLAARPTAAHRLAWRVTAAAVIGWTVGLVWMWASKWVLATLVVGVDEVVDNVKTQIEFRMSGEHEGTTGRRTEGLTDNLAEWWGRPWTPWVLVGLATVFAIVAIRCRGSRPPWTAAAACGVIVAVPVVGWYLVLNNHSQIHAWMVYRSLPLAVGGVSALAYVLLRGPAASESDQETSPARPREHPPLRRQPDLR